MRVMITVTDEDGQVYEAHADLVPAATANATRAMRRRRATTASASAEAKADQKLDFTLPARAFVKKYAGRRMSGAKRFVLLLASLANGKIDVEIVAQDLKGAWDRMTGPMGGPFNWAHPTRAKDNGWIDTPKTGVYRLRSSWQQIFASP